MESIGLCCAEFVDDSTTEQHQGACNTSTISPCVCFGFSSLTSPIDLMFLMLSLNISPGEEPSSTRDCPAHLGDGMLYRRLSQLHSLGPHSPVRTEQTREISCTELPASNQASYGSSRRCCDSKLGVHSAASRAAL